MTDVRLTATNPEDSSVVPVACNAKGELLLEEPQKFDGNLDGDLTVSGDATFGGRTVAGQAAHTDNAFFASNTTSQSSTIGVINYDYGGVTFASGYTINPTIEFYAVGSASFDGDVVIGSRNKQWMIVESNGLAHLVEQTRAAEMKETMEYPPLRDIPSELTMVEQQLQKVMERLKMTPEAGWEVWDGSDTN